MNKRTNIFIILISLFLVGTIYIIITDSKPAITYFSHDDQTSFEDNYTNLEFASEKGKNAYEISWNSGSKVDKSIYLRQDASLLFDNGRLRGVKSKWVQNTDIISLKENVSSEDSSFFQAISIHHGEIHYPDDEIKSIQQMSYDELFVVDSPNTVLESFHVPDNEFKKEWKELLVRTTKQQLLYHWHQLTGYFQINYEDYHAIPFTSLYKYHKKPLPSFNQEQTNQIIGQLWEGIYKNYIVPAANSEENNLKSFVPIILVEKQKDHLLVLYELNGTKQRLIQNLPPF
ncbi:hypothetical protein ACFQ3N_08760 [Virgibacillus byunsanensis]|uniref:Uncharacterized protein n=1 Tax=Virgibacillus byunsanensis TaxID=570945 RepID=A0ABW3LME3_9BACI